MDKIDFDLSKTYNEVNLLGFIWKETVFVEKYDFCEITVMTMSRNDHTYHKVRFWKHMASLVEGLKLQRGDHVFIKGRIEWRLRKNPLAKAWEYSTREMFIHGLHIAVLNQTFKSNLERFVNEMLEIEAEGMPF